MFRLLSYINSTNWAYYFNNNILFRTQIFNFISRKFKIFSFIFFVILGLNAGTAFGAQIVESVTFFSMPSPHSILLYIILLPIIGAFSIFLQPTNQQLNKKTALIISIITFCFSLWLWATFDASSAEMFQQVTKIEKSWKGTIWLSIELGIDGISLWMILLTTFLFPTCILCSWNTMKRCCQEFMICLLLLEGMLLAVWCILDLLCFYILYESILIPMFILIGLGGSRDRKIRAAYQLVLYTLMGSNTKLPKL